MLSAYSSPPVELPEPAEPFSRADLIFYGLDHSLASYEGRVFLDPAAEVLVDKETPREAANYAGSFWIFGHGGCFGDSGHCDVPVHDDPFDFRPPHQLTPADRVVTVTGAVTRLVEAGHTEMVVTVIAHTSENESDEVLAFDRVRLALYAPGVED
jgi:tyrosinase